ncbi:MAG: hypothetical protein ABEJ68_08870 [Halobacteriaceae archaeon]
MTERPIPKGVSPETFREVVAGWAAVGADEEPRYTADVEEETGISDAVGRQTRFLESLGVLGRDGQRHRLTDAGAEFARALDEGETDRARESLRDLLADWPVTEDVRGLLRGNPTDREQLVRHLAVLTEQDRDESRVSSGLGTLLDLYDWAGVLERDDADRYRLPEDRAGVETELAELRDELAATRRGLAADVESVRDDLEADVEAAREEARTDRRQTAMTLAELVAAAETALEGSQEETREAVAAARDALERDVAAAEMDLEADRSAVAPETEAGAAPGEGAEAAVTIRSADGPGVVLDAGAAPIEIDVDDGPTFELGAESEDESEPVPDGGQVIDLSDDAEDATLALELDADTDVEIQTGDGPGITLEPGAEPVAIDLGDGPTIELSAAEAAEAAAETVEEAAEEAEEAAEEAEETAEETAEEAEEAAGEAEETAEEAAEATEEAAGEAAEATEEAAGEEAEDVADEAENAVEAAAEQAAAATSDADADVSASVRPQTSREGEDAVAVSLDLALDADPAEVEGLVAALRDALLEPALSGDES